MKRVSGSSLRSTRQAGAVAIGTICIVLVVVATLSLALKVVPHYIDYLTIQSVIEQLPPAEVAQMPRAQVFEALDKRFPINSLYGFKVRDIIKYERESDITKLILDYEKRENLFMNLDVVIKFHKEYEYR